MKILTAEQIREIERKEEQKQIQKELEEQRIREIEMKRREEEQQAREKFITQLQQKVEPLFSMVNNLKEDDYLIMQYLNINGKVATYTFKSKEDTKHGEFWIEFSESFEPYVTDGHSANSILMSNVLGLEVRHEVVADVIEIDGIKYQRLLVDKPVEKVIPNQTTKSYKGEF